MVPAADAKISQEAMTETFLLSNIAPQVGEGFNRNCQSPRALTRIRCESRLMKKTRDTQIGLIWSRSVASPTNCDESSIC